VKDFGKLPRTTAKKDGRSWLDTPRSLSEGDHVANDMEECRRRILAAVTIFRLDRQLDKKATVPAAEA